MQGVKLLDSKGLSLSPMIVGTLIKGAIRIFNNLAICAPLFATRTLDLGVLNHGCSEQKANKNGVILYPVRPQHDHRP